MLPFNRKVKVITSPNFNKNYSWFQILCFNVVTVSGISLIPILIKIDWASLWWFLIVILIFVIPFLIVIGSLKQQYPNGNLLSWIRHAFGRKLAGYAALFYWFHTIFITAAMAILMVEIAFFTTQQFLTDQTIFVKAPQTLIWIKILFALFCIFCMLGFNFLKLNHHQWIIYLVVFTKLILIGGLIACLILWFIVFDKQAIKLPQKLNLNTGKVMFLIAFLVFKTSGFETAANFQDRDHQSGTKNIMKKLIISFLTIICLYLLTLIPSIMINQIQSKNIEGGTGLLLAPIQNLLAISAEKPWLWLLIGSIGVLIIFNLFVSCGTWMYHANKSLTAAGKHYALPRAFATETNNQKPLVTPILSVLIIGFILIVLGGLSFIFNGRGVLDLFYILFLNGLFLLFILYLILIVAALKLRWLNRGMNWISDLIFYFVCSICFASLLIAITGLVIDVQIHQNQIKIAWNNNLQNMLFLLSTMSFVVFCGSLLITQNDANNQMNINDENHEIDLKPTTEKPVDSIT